MTTQISNTYAWLKAGVMILMLTGLLGMLSGCGILKKNPVVLDEITFFSYSYGGSELYSVERYEAKLVGDHTQLVMVRPGAEIEYTFTESADFMKKLTEIANACNIGSWDGFDKHDKNVMDGSSFHISLTTRDEKSVSASGYMKYPENFGTSIAQIEELFLDIYYEAYPDPEMVLEKYMKETLIKEKGLADCEEISYAYLSAEYESEKGYYQWQVPKCQDGVHGYIITDINDDNKKEMVVTLLKNNDGIWQLGFEIYVLTEDNTVAKAGEAIIDEDLFSNDGLYGNVMLIYYTYEEPEYEVVRQIVYSAQKKYFDGDGSFEQTIKVFRWHGDSVSVAADETLISKKQEHKNWTEEDYAPFIEIADQFDWWQSRQYWKETPGDLVVTDSGLQIYRLFTSSNIKDFSDFNKVLTETKVGDPAGEYCISGTLKGYQRP